MEFKWITKSHTGGLRMHSDVRFGLQKASDRASITISAAAINMKFHETEYIIFAISGSRIYFKEADSANGYKLSRMSKQQCGTAQVTSKDLCEFLHKNMHIWDANLRYDSTYELYFVDAAKRDLAWKENR